MPVQRRCDVQRVWNIDRIGPDRGDCRRHAGPTRGSRRRDLSGKDPMDPTTPYARAMLEMAALSAELARGMIRRRVMRGLDRAKRRCVTLGRSKIARKFENARLRPERQMQRWSWAFNLVLVDAE
jgi:Resolvase, N terminal domain